MKFKHLCGFGLTAALICTLSIAKSTPPDPAKAPKSNQKSKPALPLEMGKKKPIKTEKAAQKLGPAPIESNWRERALKWFKSESKKERGKQMRSISRALKKPCKYCHTKDFKGFTQNRLITQQMMALSIEHSVECADCHAGRGQYTEFGKKTLPMWRLVHTEKVFCGHCHTKQSKFEHLTEAGRAYKNKAKN